MEEEGGTMLSTLKMLSEEEGCEHLGRLRELSLEVWKEDQHSKQVEELRQRLRAAEEEAARLVEAKEAAVAEQQALTAQMEAARLTHRLRQAEEALAMGRARLAVMQEEAARRQERFEEEETRLRTSILQQQNQLRREKTDRDRETAEGVLLLRLLNAELSKTKASCANLEAALEVQGQEEAKVDALLGLLSAQLSAARDEAKAKRLRVVAGRSKWTEARNSLAEAEEKRKQLQSRLEHLNVVNAETQQLRGYAAARQAADVRRREASVTALEEELGGLREAFSAAEDDFRRRSAAISSENASLEAEVRRTAARCSRTRQDLLEAELATFESETSRLEQATKLNIARESVSSKEDIRSLKALEEMVQGRSELDRVRAEISRVGARRTKVQQQAKVDLAEVVDTTAAVKRGTAEVAEISEVQERENFETITRVAAANEVLRRRVLQLQEESDARNVSHVKERISARSAADRYRKEADGLRQELTHLDSSSADRRTSLESAVAESAAALSARAEAAKQEVHTTRNEAQLTLQEHELIQRRLSSLQHQAAQRDRHIADRNIAFEAELNALRAQIKTMSGNVRDLEQQLAATHGYKALVEENALLEQGIAKCKKEVRHMKNTISTMTVEKGLLEGYKAKVLTEQNQSHLKQLQELELGRARLVPLLKELLITARKHSITDPVVAAAETVALDMGIACYHHPVPPPR